MGRAGADWLGWDARAGVAVDGADPVTEVPRRYGFHATIKPPFRLAAGADEESLRRAARMVAAGLRPVALGALSVRRMGRFLALVPGRNPADLAAEVVATLDSFRAPAGRQELARRRANGLSPAEEALLLRWGYPHVMDAFRIHLTLTGPDPSTAAERRARDRFTPIGGSCEIAALSLVGEDAEGRFHLLEDLPLRGEGPGADDGVASAS